MYIIGCQGGHRGNLVIASSPNWKVVIGVNIQKKFLPIIW